MKKKSITQIFFENYSDYTAFAEKIAKIAYFFFGGEGGNKNALCATHQTSHIKHQTSNITRQTLRAAHNTIHL